MSDKPTILITGASGKTGSAATIELLTQGFSVRAFVHREDSRAEQLRELGAETVVGNMLELGDLSKAMQGIQRAYFVCPWTQNQLDLAMNFAVAAADNKVKHIVALSQWLSHSTHPSMATRRTHLTDRIFSLLPETTLTVINPGFFADNYMSLLEPISQLGLMPMPLGSGRNAPVSNEDIGRCVAAALADPEKHAGKTYRPCGPELLDPIQITQIFSKVLNRKVKYQDISESMFLKAIKSMGFPLGLLSQLRLYFAEYRKDAFATAAPNDAVLYLTGQKAEDFETIVSRYVKAGNLTTGFLPGSNQVPSTQATLRNKVRAVFNFVKLLLTIKPNLEKFERQQSYPTIRSTSFALESDEWKMSHQRLNAFGSEQQMDIKTVNA